MNLKKIKLENLKVREIEPKNIGKIESPKEYLPNNVIFQKNQILTRPGTNLIEGIIFDSGDTYAGYGKTVFTDCDYYKDGEKGRVFIIIEDDEIINIYYHFYIMWSNGQSQKIGTIYFALHTGNSFSRPESYILYSGKATRGCGLYFFVRRVGNDDKEDIIEMYELNNEMSVWENIYAGDIYIPTLLAFGRGNKYYLAEEADKRISFSKPQKLEAENILTDTFYSYYTTDGYSSIFELPCNGIGDTGIICVYNDLINEYVFSIGSGQSESNIVKINSKNYRMSCNRTLGTLCFTDASGIKSALPFVGIENNLKVLASRKENDDRIKLAAMSRSVKISANGGEKGEQTVVFYGNQLDEGGKICWINSKEPLYFPKNCTATPADIGSTLKGAYTHNGRLYLYDNENVYSASVSAADGFDLPLVLKGLSNDKVTYAKIVFNQTLKLPQEIIENTVITFSDRVLFAGRDGIYEYSGNSTGAIKRVVDLSQSGFSPEFAVSYKGGYLLCQGKKAYYYDVLNNRLALWNFVAELFGGFSFSDECILFAYCLYKNNQRVIYTLRFDGRLDAAITDMSESPLILSVKVQGKITCELDVDSTFYKRMYALVLDTEPTTEKISVNILPEGSYKNGKYTSFNGGLKTVNFSARFKKMTISVLSEDLIFNRAKIIYYDGKIF